jgi:para-aminobenzoate synthetase component 1
VKKKSSIFSIQDPKVFTSKMLNWANQFNIFSFLDNNAYAFEPPAFDWVLAVGALDTVINHLTVDFKVLQSFQANQNGWIFGHLNYPSVQPDSLDFPAAFFFVPMVILKRTGSEIHIETTGEDPAAILAAIQSMDTKEPVVDSAPLTIQSRYTKEEYIQKIEGLKQHIQRGDCYEINFCQDYFIDDATIHPILLYQQLMIVSPNPFSALYKWNDGYCLCASPERFLQKRGTLVTSQPIKGTTKRNLLDPAADAASRAHLHQSEKEKSENVMIVDLVRNDLSRVCERGSVEVKELFGIYSYPQVHQMISTIQGRVSESLPWTEVVKACYPMGSMTGAPKVKVMDLIEQFETVPRGLFSGSIGYVTPEGDFDLNVVIRSLFYQSAKKRLSFKVGSGITIKSDPLLEYEECMVKASAILQILNA